MRHVILPSLLILSLTACSTPQTKDQPKPLALDPITTKESLDHAILQGRILTTRGDPLDNVTVKLYGGFATRWEVGQTTTGPDGTYRFDPFEGAGSRVKRDGHWRHYVGISLEHPTHASIDRRNWWDIDVPMQGVTRRDFVFEPAGAVSGTLTTPDGDPIAHGLRLRLSTEHDSTFWKYAESDEDGEFHVTGLHPGRYLLDLNGSDQWTNELGTFFVFPNDTTELTLALKPKSN